MAVNTEMGTAIAAASCDVVRDGEYGGCWRLRHEPFGSSKTVSIALMVAFADEDLRRRISERWKVMRHVEIKGEARTQ